MHLRMFLFHFVPHKMKFLWTSCDLITLLLRAASSNNRLLRWMWAYVREQVCVWVAVLLLAAGFEVSGSLRALVCLTAFLSHWSAVAPVAAILLQRLCGCSEAVNGRGSNLLHRDCPSKSCSQATLSPGNPHGSHREKKSASLYKPLCLSMRFPQLMLRSVFPSAFPGSQWKL